MEYLEQPLTKLYEVIYLKTLLVNKNGILKTVQVTTGSEKRKQKEKIEQKVTNKMADLSPIMLIII